MKKVTGMISVRGVGAEMDMGEGKDGLDEEFEIVK
jgi:hypothetical protein